MSKAIDAFRAQIQRPAIVFEIGGFRPPDDPATSFFGRVNLTAPGEGWPMDNATPMLPLAQLNLTTLPFRPPRLADIEFLTVFISGREAPHNAHPAAPEYVFQIASSEKAHWAWGDGGVGYFGRGTAEGHEDQWFLAWQCF